MRPDIQVSSDHYRFLRYVTKQRWSSFYHQLSEILAHRPDSVLEVGVGAGVIGSVLSGLGVQYESVDIDPELRPTHVGSVTALPFSADAYDVVACFQVLEHLPYSAFIPAVQGLMKVARSGVVLSLPDARRVWPWSVHIPHYRAIRGLTPRPQLGAPRVVWDGQHHWEINRRGYPLSRIVADLEGSGVLLKRTYRVWEHPYHRFFVLASLS